VYLDQRGVKILKMIVNDPSVSGKELEQTLGLSRKQISYSLGKINDYLKKNGFEEIKWLKTGRFLVSLAVIREYQSEDSKTAEYTYVLSDEERYSWLTLRLLCHTEELSTYHFTDELKISKNTLMSDLKRVQEIMKSYGLELNYDRKRGYVVYGEEYDKRGLIIQALRENLNIPGGEERLAVVYHIKQTELEQLKSDIKEIEEKLSVCYADERMKEFPYILAFLLRQIRNGCLLQNLPESCRHVTGTKEYMVMSSFCMKHGIDSEKEKIFFTMQLQISKYSSRNEAGENQAQLKAAAQDAIKCFERISCVQISDKEGLLEALLQHLQPAVYRIRYHYHVQPDISDMILPKYQYLHEIVKLSVFPLETLLGETMPDRETIYITALIGAWLRKEGLLGTMQPRKKAVVVCSNGITVSHFLHITLEEMFPEIEFTACLSIRGFEEYQKDFQIVFTTTRLNTDKVQFVVTPSFNEYTGKIFRQKVLRELEGVSYENVTTEGIMALIDRYAVVQERDKLEKSLHQYLSSFSGKAYPELRNEGLCLRDLLKPENIEFAAEIHPWNEAIRNASNVLWENGSIELRYINKMIRLIQENQPYIMLADGVIVAHAGVDDGVARPAMSLYRMPERISIDGYMDADIIMVLATPDKTIHLTALYQLIHLLENEVNLNKIRMAENTEELVQLIEWESSLKI